MSTNEEKLDKLTRKVIKQAGLQQPSVDFTQLAMKKVLQSHQQTAVVYKPLISNGVWGVIAVMITVLLMYVMYNTTDINVFSDASASIGSKFQNWQWNTLIPDLPISPYFTYGMLTLVILLSIEIPLIRRRFKFR